MYQIKMHVLTPERLLTACLLLILTCMLASNSSNGDGITHSTEDSDDMIQDSIQAYSEHTSMVENAMSNFSSSIATKGWEIKGVTPSDGNCCFHAVSDQLQILQPPRHITPSYLRKAVVKFMEELPQVFLHNKSCLKLSFFISVFYIS